jgi:hypothetical protein
VLTFQTLSLVKPKLHLKNVQQKAFLAGVIQCQLSTGQSHNRRSGFFDERKYIFSMRNPHAISHAKKRISEGNGQTDPADV